MKPKRIILIRHGESQANVDKTLYGSIPDYTIELTETGREQAREAGKRLKELVGNESMYFYVSPFWRARSTFEGVASAFPRSQFEYNEEPRLREQEWGYLRCPEDFAKICRERREYGTFYYRIPGGEAGSDVYDRVNDLLGSLFRDFAEDDFPENCVLITHGLTIKLFVMRFFHLTVEDFEQMKAPKNCGLVILELQKDGHYRLVTEMEKNTEPLRYARPIAISG
jgi:broad specificity phosphatase PhoE